MPTPIFGRNTKERGGRLGFVLGDGTRRSLPYFQLVETIYSPEIGGIVLESVGYGVTLHGRNLASLYEALEDEDVGEVTERHENDVGLPEAAAYITKITFERV
jgi:hypothetical protein